jgi:carbon monoxide dehydrogenase subunit G
MNISRSFTVNPAPDTVRAYLLDFAHAEQWDPGTRRCERIDTGPVRVGSSWHNVSGFLGRTVELTYTLVQADHDRVVFDGANDASTSRDDLRFTPSGGGTRIDYRATITLTGRLGKVVDPLMSLLMRRVADKTVDQMTSTLNTLA